MRARWHVYGIILVIAALLALPILADAGGNPTIEKKQKQAEPATLAGGDNFSNPMAGWIPKGRSWWKYENTGMYSRLSDPNKVDNDIIQIEDIIEINTSRPAEAMAQVPKDLVSTLPAGSADQYYILQFAGPVQQAWLDQLSEEGVGIYTYYKWFTYSVHIPEGRYEQITNLPFVKWVGVYQPAYKIDPRIGTVKYPPQEAAPGASFILEVNMFRNQDPDVSEGLLNSLGCVVIDRVVNDFQQVFIVSVPGEIIPEIAKIPSVKYINEWAKPMLRHGANAAENPQVFELGSYFTGTTPYQYRDNGLNGTGQIIAMMDEGLNVLSMHFSNTTAAAGTIGASHRKVVDYDAYGTGDLCACDPTNMSHGTWTTCMAIGNIGDFGFGDYDFGIANGARVVFQDIFTGDCSSGAVYPPTDLTASMTAAQTAGAHVQNHSWGAASNQYSSHTSQLDTFLWQNRNFMVTCSAGNGGLSSESGDLDDLATGKNVIACGGNDQDPNETELFADSSWGLGSGRGPVVSSGREKPDVLFTMADSAGVGGNASAENMAGPYYAAALCSPFSGTPAASFVPDSGLGGTSFSAPMVAGASAVIRQYFVDGYYPTGSAVPANAMTPSGMLLKAMLIASAQNMATTDSPNGNAVARRYSSDVGYGRIQLNALLPLQTGPAGPTTLYVDDNHALTTSNIVDYKFVAPSTTEELKIALAWYDQAGNALNVDYDLRVTQGSNTWYGNNFGATGYSVTGGSYDHTNSTEAVFLPAGGYATGEINVRVTAYNASGTPTPTYALVVTGNAPVVETGVSMNKAIYDCSDVIALQVIDDAGVSPVSVTITTTNGDSETVSVPGTAPLFQTTIPVNNAAVGANNGTVNIIDGATITATYSGTYTAVATANCSYDVCVYLVRTLEGGCDNDPYHDQGENLNYWVAMENNDTLPTPSPFSAKLRAVNDTNGYVTILQDTCYWDVLSAGGAAYPDLPFLVRYNGPIGSACDSTIEFEVYDVQSYPDSGASWQSTGCGAANQFTETGNWDLPTAVLSQDFEGTFPPTGWTVTGGTGQCTWQSLDTVVPQSNPNPRGNYTGGTGLCAVADSDACGNTAMNTTLRSQIFSLSGVSAASLSYRYHFMDYADGNASTATVSISTNNGSTWTQLTQYTGDDVELTGLETISLTPYVGNSQCYIRFVYVTAGWEWWWQVDDVTVYAGDEACEDTVCTPAPDLIYADNWVFDDSGCNNDGYLDAGEIGELTLYIDNQGSDWAYDTTATLSTTTTGVTICSANATYGDIPMNPDSWIWGANPTFYIALDPATLDCTDGVIDFTLNLSANGGAYTVARAVQLPVGSIQQVVYYQDMCGLDPNTAGATGRVGFTTAWTTSNADVTITAASTICDNDDGNNSVWTQTTSNTNRTINHTFSTVGVTDNVIIYWAWDPGTVTTARYYRLYYTTNGSTWTEIAAVATAGTGTGAGDWQCWSGSLLATTGDTAILNNPNFGIRFSLPRNGRIDNPIIIGTAAACSATTCDGVCPQGCSMTVDVTPNGTTTECGGEDIVFTATPSGGTAPYTYQWTENGTDIPGANNSTYTANKASGTFTYNCKVDDSDLCTDITDATASTGTWTAIPATPTATNNGPICAGSTLNLYTGTVAGATYAWTGPSGFTSALEDPTIPNATTAATGLYSVTVTVAGCTSAAGTTNATVNATPATPTATNNGPICAGSTLNLHTDTVSGATYAWTGPNSFTSALEDPTIPSATTAATGLYSVTVTVDGCTSAAGTTNATVNAIPATPTATNNGPICAGSTLNLYTDTVAGATYSWTGPNGFTSSLEDPSIANATTAASGLYSVTVTVAGCTSAAGTTNATVNALPTPTITGDTANTCPVETVLLTTQAGMSSYQWYVGGSPIGGANASTYTVTATGSYTVSYTDGNGCSGLSAAHVVTITSCGCTAPIQEVIETVNGKVGFNWVDTDAANYRVVRGLLANLPALITAGTDFACTAAFGDINAVDIQLDDPQAEAGRCYYYLIQGYNGTDPDLCVGPAGPASAGARQVELTNTCD